MLVLRGAVAGTLAITITQVLVGALLTATAVSLPQQPPNMLPWLVLSNLVLAIGIAWLAGQSRQHGWALVLTLWVVALVVGPVTSLIEAVFFNVFTASQAFAVSPNLVLPQVVGVLAIAYATGTWRVPGRVGPAAEPPRWLALVARGAAASAFYVVCYFVAGTFVFPYVRDFYATRVLPSGGTILAMQLLVRGPMFVAVIALAVRQVPPTRAVHALVGVVIMAILGGMVGLLTPNSFMPDVVRYAHMVEVVTSNSVFGAVTAWLMSPGRAILAAPSRPLEASAEGIAHERIR